MPELKPPAPLVTISMASLVKFVMRYLDELDAEGSTEKFRHGVSVIKKDLRDQIPRHFLPEFTDKFLKEWKLRRCDDNSWEISISKAALEMLMDVEIVGLKCDERILECVDPSDMHRLSGLGALNIDYHATLEVLPVLENCNLNDLTTLVLSHVCTDQYLTVIGLKCSKLRSIRFNWSKITDKGLRALDSCRELRCVGFDTCKDISHVGINHLLSVHGELESLSHVIWERSDWNQLDGCHFLSCLERPCLSLKRFHIKTDEITDAHLRSMVLKFPNLTHIELGFESIGDLSILESLSNFEGIRVEFSEVYSNYNFHSAWQSLENLLTLIGGNITSLEFCFYRRACILESGCLNFIFKTCPNLQNLKLQALHQDLVVPPFQKLKVLSLSANLLYRNDSMAIQVEKIGSMLNLEYLELSCFNITADTIKSMMLDNTKFPKLRRLVVFDGFGNSEVREFRQFSISNNLDFELSQITQWDEDVPNSP